MQYLKARLRKTRTKKLHDIFVADSLKNINDSVAKTFGGSYMKKRYADMLIPSTGVERTADEIINSISEGLKQLGAE